MNSTAVVLTVAAGATALAAGLLGGHALGRRYSRPSWRLWALYAGSFVVCPALCATGLAAGERWLAVGALGLLGGLLTGIKYGARGGFVPEQRS